MDEPLRAGVKNGLLSIASRLHSLYPLTLMVVYFIDALLNSVTSLLPESDTVQPNARKMEVSYDTY